MLLAAIFSIMEKSLYLIREMNDLAGYVLLHRTLEASPSILGYHVVKVVLRFVFWLFIINSHCNYYCCLLFNPHNLFVRYHIYNQKQFVNKKMERISTVLRLKLNETKFVLNLKNKKH